METRWKCETADCTETGVVKSCLFPLGEGEVMVCGTCGADCTLTDEDLTER